MESEYTAIVRNIATFLGVKNFFISLKGYKIGFEGNDTDNFDSVWVIFRPFLGIEKFGKC
jgi:hypothetical protein